MKTEPIVVLGGGFGGLRVALDLDRRLGHELAVPIFLIDASPYHIASPTLYSLASAPEPKVASIAFEDILAGTNIRFLQERVVGLDVETKQVVTERRRIRYSDVILALGSQSRPVERKSDSKEEFLTCQTIDEVLAIRQRLANCFARAAEAPRAECHSHIIVVGGGVTGVEFAAGLRRYVHGMAANFGVSANGVHITLVESAKELLPGLPKRASVKAKVYLTSLGITLRLGTAMTWRGSKQLMGTKTVLPAKTVVWTIGRESHPVVQAIKGLRHDERGRVLVDATLQALGHDHIWALGDAASILDSGSAEAAIAHGRHLAEAITAKRLQQTAPNYRPHTTAISLELSPSYGISVSGERVADGISVIWSKRWSTLRYYFSILPFSRVFSFWINGGQPVSSQKSTCVTWSDRHKAAA